jgi:hypothetical protein
VVDSRPSFCGIELHQARKLLCVCVWYKFHLATLMISHAVSPIWLIHRAGRHSCLAFVSGGGGWGEEIFFPFGLFSKNFVRAAHNPTAPGKRKKREKNITSGRANRKDIQGLWKMQNKHKRRGQRVNDQRSDWVNQNDKTPSFHYALRTYLSLSLSLSYYTSRWLHKK